MNYNKTLGEYLEEKRFCQGITKGQLCRGLCDNSTYGRYEADIIVPDRFMIGALLERLGENSENISYICSDDEILFRNYRTEIDKFFFSNQFDRKKIIEILDQYQSKVTARSKKIHLQYIDFIQGKLAETEGNVIEAKEKYVSALNYTKVDFENPMPTLLLTIQEFEIIYSLYKIDNDIEMLVKLENIISLKKDYHVLKVHFLGDLILNIIHADALSDTKIKRYIDKAIDYKKRIYQLNGIKDLLWKKVELNSRCEDEFKVIDKIEWMVREELWQNI